ncbi:MAG: hypothetical protein ABIR37_00320 [Candidatus Saccharimonadales bacterium]
MVDAEGIRPSVNCTYTFERQTPLSLERERMGLITGAFAVQGYDAYSVMLDPATAGFTRQEQFMKRSLEEAALRDMLFAIVTSEEPDEWLMLHAGATRAHGGEVVVAYHNSVLRSSRVLDAIATHAITWKSISKLTEAIQEQVCDNVGNDSNVIGISQRKTA